MQEDDLEGLTRAHTRLQMRFGWWALLCFLTMGIALEMLHGFKVGWYLNVENEARRLMWTLAHTHGTMLAIVNLAFGMSLAILPLNSRRRLVAVSRCLMGATLLLPAGFFLGGIYSVAGDPGLGIMPVPVGALLLLVGVFLVAQGSKSDAPAGGSKSGPSEQQKNAKARRN